MCRWICYSEGRQALNSEQFRFGAMARAAVPTGAGNQGAAIEPSWTRCILRASKRTFLYSAVELPSFRSVKSLSDEGTTWPGGVSGMKGDIGALHGLTPQEILAGYARPATGTFLSNSTAQI